MDNYGYGKHMADRQDRRRTIEKAGRLIHPGVHSFEFYLW
tara:strand:+ start:6122 stop:6241 length:120 start_codon:yes stop_codon:yes gene_type:complete